MTGGMFDRLVGIVPQVVVMGITDKIRDAFIGAIEGVAENIADAMTTWATWGIETSIRLLGGNILPDINVFFEGPISVMFGANYGLAFMIAKSLVVIAIVVTAIAAFRQRRTEFAGNVLGSIIGLFVFAVLFFPFYTLLFSGLREISAAVLKNAADASDSSIEGLIESLATLRPGNLALQFLNGLINGTLSTVLLIELGAMVAIGVILSIFYPLSIAMRPFGKLGLNLFRVATAAVISIPLSLLFMMGLLAMELLLIRGTNSVAPFLGGFAGLLLSIVFGLLIVLTPLGVFSLAYTKVEEMVGSTDSKIDAGIDVLTMPDINSRNIADDSSRNRLQYVREFASDLPGAIASGENSPGTEAKELAKQIGIRAAASSTNPVIAAGALAYTGYKVASKVKEAMSPKEGGDSQ